MAKVYIEDIWIEDLFKWYSDHISDSGGDGAGIICCTNPDETATMFIKWWRAENPWFKGTDFVHDREEYTHDGIHYINYHNSNENYMFCDKETDLGFHDYSFVVKGDCRFGHHTSTDTRRILALNS